MRGLDIRSSYARAMVMTHVEHPKAASEMNWAIEDARVLGASDYKDGNQHPPALFAGIPALLDAWNDGWDIGIDLEDAKLANDCPRCNDPDGCPLHD